MDHPDGKQVLPLKWVFTYKFDDAGYLVRHKARICVRGDLQHHVSDDMYAATGAYRSFRILMALVCASQLLCHQIDFVIYVYLMPFPVYRPGSFRFEFRMPFLEGLISGMNWKEGIRDENDGLYHVPAEDWDSEALLYVLQILHLRNGQVPRTIPLEMLVR